MMNRYRTMCQNIVGNTRYRRIFNCSISGNQLSVIVSILFTCAHVSMLADSRVVSSRGQGQPLVESWQASMWLAAFDRIPCQNLARLQPLFYRQWPLEAAASNALTLPQRFYQVDAANMALSLLAALTLWLSHHPHLSDRWISARIPPFTCL